MVTPDPSVPVPILFGIICVFVIIILIDEIKRFKNKS
jgi:hypothetical protein